MAKTNQTIEINGRNYNMRTSDFTTNLSPIHVSDKMTGKMQGIPSISTSCHCNQFCLARMAKGDYTDKETGKTYKCICKSCFADSTLDRYHGLENATTDNYYLLNESILDDSLLPIFGNVRFVRIESYGDLGSATQAINYLNIIRKNPDVTFAWWTKNPNFINQAMKILEIRKPENVIFIQSSCYVNLKTEKKFDWIDKVFTVYDKKFIQENGLDINCGARSCVNCKRCYSLKNKETEVSEMLK